MVDLDPAMLSSHLSIPKRAQTKRYIWLIENQTSVISPAIIQKTKSHNMSTKPMTVVNNTIFYNTVFTRVIQCL